MKYITKALIFSLALAVPVVTTTKVEALQYSLGPIEVNMGNMLTVAAILCPAAIICGRYAKRYKDREAKYENQSNSVFDLIQLLLKNDVELTKQEQIKKTMLLNEINDLACEMECNPNELSKLLKKVQHQKKSASIAKKALVAGTILSGTGGLGTLLLGSPLLLALICIGLGMPAIPGHMLG